MSAAASAESGPDALSPYLASHFGPCRWPPWRGAEVPAESSRLALASVESAEEVLSSVVLCRNVCGAVSRKDVLDTSAAPLGPLMWPGLRWLLLASAPKLLATALAMAASSPPSFGAAPPTPKDFVSAQFTSPVSSTGHSPFQSHTQSLVGQVVALGLVMPDGSLQLFVHQSSLPPSMVATHLIPIPAACSFSNPAICQHKRRSGQATPGASAEQLCGGGAPEEARPCPKNGPRGPARCHDHDR